MGSYRTVKSNIPHSQLQYPSRRASPSSPQHSACIPPSSTYPRTGLDISIESNYGTGQLATHSFDDDGFDAVLLAFCAHFLGGIDTVEVVYGDVCAFLCEAVGDDFAEAAVGKGEMLAVELGDTAAIVLINIAYDEG
jgi:hypothetical protein